MPTQHKFPVQIENRCCIRFETRTITQLYRVLHQRSQVEARVDVHRCDSVYVESAWKGMIRCQINKVMYVPYANICIASSHCLIDHFKETIVTYLSDNMDASQVP